MPEVSVIIPVYNRASLISEAIDSVLAQTFEDYELIMVDDGSTDGSVDAILSYGDPRIILCRHERNKGEAAARNTGIARSSGRYIAWLDSDDIWHPAKLERQIAVMRDRKSSASFSWFSIERAPGDSAEKRQTKQSRNWFWTLLFSNTLAPGSTMMVERVWFDRIGLYDESIPCGTDADWLLRLSLQSSMTIIEEDLAVIRKFDGGVAGLCDDDPLARFHEAWTASESGKPRLTAREKRRFQARISVYCAVRSRRSGNNAKMARHLARAVMLSPAAMTLWFIDRVIDRMPAWLNPRQRG